MCVTERFTYENGADARRFSRSFSTLGQQLCKLTNTQIWPRFGRFVLPLETAGLTLALVASSSSARCPLRQIKRLAESSPAMLRERLAVIV